MARTPLTLPMLVEALRRQFRVLEQYHRYAFVNLKDDYLGEVAGKIRLLASNRGRNKPLLLNLMDEFGFTYKFTLDGPPVQLAPGEIGPGSRVSLSQFLASTAFGVRDPSTNDMVTVTVIESVCNWANQFGSAHVDPSIDRTSVGFGYVTHLFGHSLIRQRLEIISRVILAAGRDFDRFLTPNIVDNKLVEAGLPDNPLVGHIADRAAALLRLKRPQDGLDCCNEGIARFPYAPELKLQQALAFSELQQYENALQNYTEIINSRRLLAASPALVYLVYYNRACMQMRANRPEDSLESLRIAGKIGNLEMATTDAELALLKYDSVYQRQFDQIVSESQKMPKMDISVI